MTDRHIGWIRRAWALWTLVAVLGTCFVIGALQAAVATHPIVTKASGFFVACVLTFCIRLIAEVILPCLMHEWPVREVPAHLSDWRIYRSDLPGYMHRWIWQSPLGTLRVHRILRSDDDRALHDHPWAFWSLLLGRGYTEVVPVADPRFPMEMKVQHRPWSVVRHKATDAHRIELTDGSVWTLVWTGRFQRQWGFWTPEDVGESNLERLRRWVSFREWRDLHPEKSWAAGADQLRRDRALEKLPKDVS